MTCTQLLDTINRKGGLAQDVNLEVDGGSENQNKTVFALCAHLVLKGCTKRITINRLPIHHTHNQLDAYFGKLSQNCKGRDGCGKTRHSLGAGSMSQQDWKKTAEVSNNLSSIVVLISNFPEHAEQR